MTPLIDHDDYEKLNVVCAQLKALIEPSSEPSWYSNLIESASNFDQQQQQRNQEVIDYVEEDEVKEITVVKYEISRKVSRKLSLSKKQQRSNRISQGANSNLPNDFTDYDGYKHYFV